MHRTLVRLVPGLLLGAGLLLTGCTDESPVAMTETGLNEEGPGVVEVDGAPVSSSIDFRTAGTWDDLPFNACAQSGGVQGTGAGVFPSFLLYGTAQGRNDGKGYNTDASGGQNRQYEISGGSNTRSVPLNSIPTVAVDPAQAGACADNVIYREFRFDGQAPGAEGKQEYSLDDIRVYLVPNEGANNAISDFLVDDVEGPRVALNSDYDATAGLVWDMNYDLGYESNGYPNDPWEWLWVSSDISSGQGASDLRLLIPNDYFLDLIPQDDYQACAFTGFDYSAGGTSALDSDCPWLIYFVSSHGFASEKESGNSEWSVAFRPTLLVSKTAVGKYDQTYDWTVTKEADKDSWDLFEGDEATAAYEVTATKGDPVDHNVRIEGVITLENVSDEDVTVTGIRDVLSLEGKDDTVLEFADMECDFELDDVIPAGESRSCSYRQDLGDDERGIDGTNEVVVTAADPLDAADDGSLAFAGYAPVTWSAEPEIVRNDDVDVKDVLADGGDGITQIDQNISETTTFDYEHTFACDADEGDNTNTVTVYGDPLETGGDPEVLDFASETVAISCYELTVTKDATTEFTRTFDWEIDKYAGPESDPITEIEIMPLQSYLLTYTVDVSTTGYTDSDWKVYGDITVSNPAPIGVELTGVSDVVSTDIEASVDCGVTFPYMLASGDDLECSYEAALPNGDNGRVNTATATIQNRGFYLDEGELAYDDLEDKTTDFTGTADVVFGDPTTLVNQCVDVSDAFDGEDPARDLGTVCVPTTGEGAYESASASFDYVVQFGGADQDASADVWFGDADLECFDNYFTNTAAFASQSLDELDNPLVTGEAEWTVNVFLACDIGCTLTQGYWRTHNQYFRDIRNGNGPPKDETWTKVGLGLEGGVTGSGVNSTFFYSDETWGMVIWPERSDNSNLYYQAARQWVAAYLNVVAISELDESPYTFAEVLALYPEVEEAFNEGLAFFDNEDNTPDTTASLKGRDAQDIKAWKSVLAAFNEGDIGPGHCDEDSTSEQ